MTDNSSSGRADLMLLDQNDCFKRFWIFLQDTVPYFVWQSLMDSSKDRRVTIDIGLWNDLGYENEIERVLAVE